MVYEIIFNCQLWCILNYIFFFLVEGRDLVATAATSTVIETNHYVPTVRNMYRQNWHAGNCSIINPPPKRYLGSFMYPAADKIQLLSARKVEFLFYIVEWTTE